MAMLKRTAVLSVAFFALGSRAEAEETAHLSKRQDEALARKEARQIDEAAREAARRVDAEVRYEARQQDKTLRREKSERQVDSREAAETRKESQEKATEHARQAEEWARHVSSLAYRGAREVQENVRGKKHEQKRVTDVLPDDDQAVWAAPVANMVADDTSAHSETPSKHSTKGGGEARSQPKQPTAAERQQRRRSEEETTSGAEGAAPKDSKTAAAREEEAVVSKRQAEEVARKAARRADEEARREARKADEEARKAARREDKLERAQDDARRQRETEDVKKYQSQTRTDAESAERAAAEQAQWMAHELEADAHLEQEQGEQRLARAEQQLADLQSRAFASNIPANPAALLAEAPQEGDVAQRAAERSRRSCESCDGGKCDQTACYMPACDGGMCNQSGAFKPKCGGGRCDQTGARVPSCQGGKCVQKEAHLAFCEGGHCAQIACVRCGCKGGGCQTKAEEAQAEKQSEEAPQSLDENVALIAASDDVAESTSVGLVLAGACGLLGFLGSVAAAIYRRTSAATLASPLLAECDRSEAVA
eukprot:TRINITY_DN21032_c0_g1_i1.p1 TRINITY_DN21032_c0_g1~~TRINITY_DN21032_c0_g1_i1.p1  ORF type:complete len:540 (+),score=159.99 TRINITY_DN21032_c0_g1_i1:86-1705(+)